MKKSLLCVLVALVLNLSLQSPSYSDYAIIRLTDNEFADYQPVLNNNGEVLWQRTFEDGSPALFFYDGATIHQITDEYSSPSSRTDCLNDSGQFSWTVGDGDEREIFMYDGTEVVQLSHNDYDDYIGGINNQGQVVWWGEPDVGDLQIFLFDGTSVTQLTDSEGENCLPQINDSGQIVWTAVAGGDWEIFLYDGENIIQLTDNDYEDAHFDMNNLGQIAWLGEAKEYPASPTEVFFYDGTQIIQLTDNDFVESPPRISDNGQVVWSGRTTSIPWPPPDSKDTEIFLYDGTRVIQVTDNDYDDQAPEINAHGQVVWYSHSLGGGADEEIFLYDGATVAALTDNDYLDWNPRINDSGQIVWDAAPGGGKHEIFLATKTFHYDEETTPEDPVVQAPDGSTISFETVTGGGTTTVEKTLGTPQVPGNFRLPSTPCYVYDIHTTATFENGVSVCIKYDEPLPSFDENQMRLLHEEDGIFVDRTASLDTVNNIVCAEVDGFSDFVVASKGQETSGWGAASTTGTELGSISIPVNCLLFLLLPIVPFAALPALRSIRRGALRPSPVRTGRHRIAR